ncbi:unnamed protein product [Rotaria magnacalcarata]|uniref:Macoilin n=2 Tax=Rotaria magnacalcarata TaxID=392030 RepID=A0A816YGW0_9BILA|nr:unnamed protein product [Rotaria magnacalcarata]CAF2256591.1 unnamed protein product [Rotaria magnacalcarata]CAF3758998.1 unnamed protein product [Rotaria magnacalcarata]CAF3798238.1 unnamed protein product [Rotaria magnacalcarata]
MKRRTNFDSVKVRKSTRRPRLTEGIYGSALMYLKFICIWGVIMAADFLLEFRFEFLWPFWLVLRSICDSFKYQGLLFSIFFVLIAFVTDLICYILLPVQWLFFAASSYVWIQYVWQTERGICLGTVVLWVLFVWLEASVRLREIKTIDLCRPFAAHCIGYPMVTLGFGFKTYLAYKWRLRKQRDVRKMNETYIQLINQALPVEIQQEAEKERLSREKGTFSENYDDLSQSNSDGTYPPSPSPSSTIVTNFSSTSLSNNSTVNNSQTQSSSFCTVSKRSSKVTSTTINNSDGVSSSNSNPLVQTTTRNNKIQTTTTTTTNGHDDSSLSFKQQKQNSSLSNLNNATNQQQKKQSQKSSNAQQQTTTNTQSRRQSKKQEPVQPVSRDSSASYVNGFEVTTLIDNSDIEKNLQISKLEADIQRLNQILDKHKYSEIQLRTQVTDLKNLRKDLEDMRAENNDLKTKYDSVNTQRQRDKQRLTDLERNLNEERLNKQRLESQIKTEKSLTKKLQDDLTKLSLTPAKSECTEQCLKRKRDLENETREMRKLLNDKDERIKILDNEITGLKYRESQADTEVLYQHLSQIGERNAQLQDSLSAETRIKLDLFSALGEVKRQLEIANGAIREKERDLIIALQSQHQSNNCIFNGHPHSHCSTSSGHSSPTHQLIDTNNNPTAMTSSCSTTMFYPPTAVTPPPLQNATSNLDPNAQDFCLSTHSTSNN